MRLRSFSWRQPDGALPVNWPRHVSRVGSHRPTGRLAARRQAVKSLVLRAGGKSWIGQEATTPDICTAWVYKKQMNRDWATVGSTYIWNASQGVTGHFSYQKSQNSSLGIAFKATVSATPVPSAGFSADGTRTDNSQTTVGYPNRGTGYDIEYQTQWRTALYQQQCTGGIPKPIHWHVRENSWIGGQKLITETSPPSTATGICAQYLPGPGSSFQTGSAQAIKWTASLGLDMGDVSFEATSQTGYDTNAQITYGFANATHVNYVCGTNTVPSNAWRVVVQSNENP